MTKKKDYSCNSCDETFDEPEECDCCTGEGTHGDCGVECDGCDGTGETCPECHSSDIGEE